MMSPATQQLFIVGRAPLIGASYRLGGKHLKSLPAILCALCKQRWIHVGLDYPAVAPSSLAQFEPYFSIEPITEEKFQNLCRDIQAAIQSNMPIKPGSEFGVFEGKLVGLPTDICFSDSWTIFMKGSAYSALQKAGITRLVGVPAKLRSRRKDSEPLMEIQLEAHGRLAKRSLPARGAPPCPSCGYRGIKLPEMFWIEERSLPKDLDLFRLLDLPGYIVATERFANVVKSLNLTGAVFEPLNVDPS